MDVLKLSRKPCSLPLRTKWIGQCLASYTASLLFILTLSASLPAWSADIGVFGPLQFTRASGAPVAVQQAVTVTNPSVSYRLIIVNGDLEDNTQIGDYVSSSMIQWNDVLIAGPDNFNQQTASLSLPVSAQSNNILTVELNGKPGGSLTVQLLRGNQPPLADAGADQTLIVGAIAGLDGSASTDGDGDALSYRWRLTEAPAASLSEISHSTDLRPHFEVDSFGHYQAELIVNDGFTDSAPAFVAIDTRNSPRSQTPAPIKAFLSAAAQCLTAASLMT